MWIAFDIETYEKYDGSKKSLESIKADTLFTGDIKQQAEQRKNFKIEKGFYYPVLNSRKFVLGCAVTDEGEKVVFYNHKQLWNWLIKKVEANAKRKRKTYIFGHNIEYDLYGLIKDNLLNLISSNLDLISERPFLGSWNYEGKNWGFFVDSFSFFRNMSVEQIGNILGYEKLCMPKKIKEVEELKNYCMRDCEIVLKGMQFLKDSLKELGFTPRKFLTAGQVAMSTFMSSIRKDNIHWNIMESGEVYKGQKLEKCRPAYRGARNEAFKTGKIENVTSIDINSLYPYAMVNMPFPKLNEEMFVKNPLEKGLEIKEILDKKFVGVLECEIEVPEISLGYLPIRFQGKLHFPEGRRLLKGTWTTLEIRKALSLGYELKKINWICLYPVNKENVFEGYINKLYNLRKRSDKGMNLAIKLIMNNLYGKFAQFRQNKEFKVIYREEMTMYKKKGWGVKSVWGNQYIVEKYNELYVPKYTNLLIAILITAYGRDYLYSFLSKIKKDDLIYCDTDGIVLRNWGKYKNQFKISDELGDWKIVAENEECFVKGEKDYRVGNNYKVSGVSKKVLAQIDFDKTDKVIQKRRVGIKDALREPGNFLNELGSFRNYEIVFKLQGKKDIHLPEVIDERREWVNIFD